MATKAKKVRCPMQDECERTCKFEFKELECDYYRNNAIGDKQIEDQEKLRELRSRALDEKAIADTELIENAEDEKNSFDIVKVLDSSLSCGDLSEGSAVNMIELGRITNSNNNIFTVEDDITDLAEDIKVNGLLSPLTVCPSEEEGFYRLISGHRRYKALCTLYENSFEVPCLITWPKSPEAEQYMLIRANTSSRQLNYNEINESRIKAEEILLKLKSQGVEMPGKLRTHVAKLLEISEAKLAKSKYIDEHLIPEIKGVSDEVLPFDYRYKIAHWSEDLQKECYEKKMIGRKAQLYDVGWWDSKIKAGENPFVVLDNSQKSFVRKCGRSKNYNNDCDNVEVFESYKGHTFNRFGVVYICPNSCCGYCGYRHICPGVCSTAKEEMNDELVELDIQDFYVIRIVAALRNLLLEKDFCSAKVKDLLSFDCIDIEDSYDSLFKYPYSETFDVMSLLWYLSHLKMTPNEFFEYVEKHTDNPRELEDGEKITWKIYLGEDK